MKRQINFWFICRFTMLCIILEERRKMRKKILDAALLFAFALCLIVTSNIQEEAAYVAELENEAVPLQNQEAEPEEMQIFRRCGSCNFRKFIYHRIRCKKQVLKRKMLF